MFGFSACAKVCQLCIKDVSIACYCCSLAMVLMEHPNGKSLGDLLIREPHEGS